MASRPIQRQKHAVPAIGGAGVHLHRAFGFGTKAQLQQSSEDLERGTFLAPPDAK